MKTNLKITVITLFLAVFCGCLTKESGGVINPKDKRIPVNKYPFYEITIDELPDPQDVKGILVMSYNHPSIPCYVLVIGDIREIERIVGFNLGFECEQSPVEQDKEWIKKILAACQRAERDDEFLGYGSNCRLAFVTEESAEMLQFDERNGKAIGKGYQSEELEEYFMQLFKKHNIDD